MFDCSGYRGILVLPRKHWRRADALDVALSESDTVVESAPEKRRIAAKPLLALAPGTGISMGCIP
jgi:hypothetical protein